EVDLLLGLRVGGCLPPGLLGAHRSATLPEAQAHIRAKPSASGVAGAQPSASRMRETSAFVRPTSPRAEPVCVTASVRPETASSSAIASSIDASSPPPTL